ncbi:MAG TPA: hypothetical protein VFY87_29850, partial [Geminicoccaceae bacterium]|nr:hypothetical protein [Geminicoccaceae bacterium]
PMRLPLLLAAALAAGTLSASLVGAEEATTTTQGGTAQSMTGQGAAAGTAAQGGVQGDCPAGQVMSAGGACAPGQPAGADMPATAHQQELLKGQQGTESAPQQ